MEARAVVIVFDENDQVVMEREYIGIVVPDVVNNINTFMGPVEYMDFEVPPVVKGTCPACGQPMVAGNWFNACGIMRRVWVCTNQDCTLTMDEDDPSRVVVV